MSIESTIKKKGCPLMWTPVTSGTYDFASRTVISVPGSPKKIYGVLDGFGSVESTLKGEKLRFDTTEETGSLRMFTVAPIKTGDLIAVLDDRGVEVSRATVGFVKLIYKGSKVVLREGQINK